MDVAAHIKGKTVLVTGGTGSFGNAVVENLLKLEPRQVVVMSRDEKKQLDMANHFRDPRLRLVIGDVRDKNRVHYLMRGVDLVFHAAALKQVPHCEFFPVEALLTNAIGAHHVIDAAVHHDAERVVVLSTDKAVYPINAMGITKALMERIMVATSREKFGKTTLCGTRYGNVMYTRGSVLPYFVDLMKKGEPLQITDGSMTRFMMTLAQSVDLVLYALTNGKDGEIYVRKAPAATVGDVAQAMIELFNYKGGVREIGIRPGEKLHETLISSEEAWRVEDCGEYYKIKPEVPGMDSTQYYTKGRDGASLLPAEGYNSANTTRLTVAQTKELLLTLPEIQQELRNFKQA